MTDRAIRIVYFGDDRAHLVNEALCPVARRLASESGSRVYLSTHWARGPHYDLVIGQYDMVPDRHVEIAYTTIREWLARNPSTSSLPADHLARSRRMADAEQWHGAIEPPYSNNEVMLTSEVRTTLWASAALAQAAAIFHGNVLPEIGYLAAARTRSRAALILRACRLLASVGHMGHDLEFAFWPTSLSAHARLFLTAHPSLRPTFEATWERLEQSVSIGDLMADGHVPTDLAAWIGAGTQLTESIRHIQDDNHETLTPIDVDNPLHIRETLGSNEAVTSRLTALFDTDRHQAVVASPRHRRFRVVINVIYEALAVATLSPVERALACYLIARAILTSYPSTATRASASIAEMANAVHA